MSISGVEVVDAGEGRKRTSGHESASFETW